MTMTQSTDVPSSNSDRIIVPPTFDKNRADKKGPSLTRLRDQLREPDAPLHRYRFDPAVMRIRDGQLDLGDRRLALGETGLTQLSQQVRALDN